MTEENPLTAKVRPHVERIKQAIEEGDEKARQIRDLYALYVACPSDQGAAGLCSAALDVWLKEKTNGN